MDPVEQLVTMHSTQVQFRDLDPLEHANNAVYLSWMEDARVEFLYRWGIASAVGEIDFVVARTEIDFEQPVFERQQVDVKVIASRIGKKSFDLQYAVLADGELCARALTVMVCYDRDLRKAKPMPSEWRLPIEQQVQAVAGLDAGSALLA